MGSTEDGRRLPAAPRRTVAAVARRLEVAPATLRTRDPHTVALVDQVLGAA
jgi:hypothetical protein